MFLILKSGLLYCTRSTFSSMQTSKLKDTLPGPGKLLDMSNFKYLITKPPCSRDSSQPYFVTLVHTAPTHIERRMAARETWAHSDPRTLTYFMIGYVASPSIQKRINQEEAKHHDIIQGNFVDSYHNLTYKVL